MLGSAPMSRWVSLPVAALLWLGQACTLETAGKGNTIIDAGALDGGSDSGVYTRSAAPPKPVEPDPWAAAGSSAQDTARESNATAPAGL